MLITPDPGEHAAYLQHFIDLGFGEIYVHNAVGREQEPFIRLYGEEVIQSCGGVERGDRGDRVIGKTIGQ